MINNSSKENHQKSTEIDLVKLKENLDKLTEKQDASIISMTIRKNPKSNSPSKPE